MSTGAPACSEPAAMACSATTAGSTLC
jgi:hypothetical protein